MRPSGGSQKMEDDSISLKGKMEETAVGKKLLREGLL